MKNKWVKVSVITVIIVIVFIVGVEITYHSLITDCCSCCDDTEQICISACCKCGYNTFEKIGRMIEYFKE